MMHRALNHNVIRKETTMNAQEHPTIQQLRNAYDAEMKNILTRRGIYYAARLITSQKGTVFKNDDYNAIKKVYSIWICTQGYRI